MHLAVDQAQQIKVREDIWFPKGGILAYAADCNNAAKAMDSRTVFSQTNPQL